ncbi:hypothetical protein [Streptosporangium vulgare]|uniref:Ricin B lectin domain-containing protein n=1 Tax=Streptosporangium vulgare TaxID=46190 RepID=A0ABV5TT69_9ACTN
MTELITAVEAHDIRFLASRYPDGSETTNPEPGCSAAYVIVRTSGGSANLQWQPVGPGNGRYQIVNRGTGAALHDMGGTAESPLAMWVLNADTDNHLTFTTV